MIEFKRIFAYNDKAYKEEQYMPSPFQRAFPRLEEKYGWCMEPTEWIYPQYDRLATVIKIKQGFLTIAKQGGTAEQSIFRPYLKDEYAYFFKQKRSLKMSNLQKEDFSAWYIQTIKQADLMDYSPVRG